MKTVRSAFWASWLALALSFGAQAHDGTPAPITVTEGGSRVVSVATGRYHTCALRAGGSVDCWGYDNSGQATDQAGPYVSVSTGRYHACGLRADGVVDCWGGGINGDGADHAGPHASVSAGAYHACALRADGSVDCWGDNGFGQADNQAGPYVSVSAGGYHTCALRADGSVDCWGWNVGGQAADQAGPYVSVSAGYLYTCALRPDGSVDCWGSNGFGQGADQAGPYLSISTGEEHTCALRADGSVDCWGDNTYGQAVDHAGPYVSVSAGGYHTCGVKADGGVECWGAGEPGSSGDPSYGQSTVPAALSAAGSTGFGQIAAGNAHACQVRRDGTLGCWGANGAGQTNAPGAGGFTQAVAGDYHGCALDAAHHAACWGYFQPGTFGSPSASDAFQRLALSAVGAVGYSCGLKVDGSAQCWHPQLGQTDAAPGPYRTLSVSGTQACAVKVDGGAECWTGNGTSPLPGDWQQVEAGLAHACGLKADGGVVCWGDDSDGQMQGLEPGVESPLYALAGVFRALSVGGNHACAIRENGALACWGSNVSGQTAAPAGTYMQVAAGNTFTCAIRSDGVRVCWGSDNQGQAPQLAMTPGSIADGLVGTAHAGATFALSDASPTANPNAPYAIQTPAFAVTSGALPPGLSLSTAGVLSGTPTTGGTYAFTVEGEDANGFAASHEYTTTITADGTAPVIDYTLSGGPMGNNGWYTGNVTVSWSVVDMESAITGSTGCEGSTLATDAIGQSYTCTATSAGGTGSKTTSTLKRDATAPTITATETTTPDGNNGWYRGNATVHFACDDALSGIASCPADQTLSADGTAVGSNAGIATDNAGNTATSNVVTVKIDKTAPTLAPTTPSPLLRGHDYSANPNASDATSGVASSGCGALDTGSPGGKSTTCSATDKAGNAKTVTLNYTVTTTCSNEGYSGTQLTWCKDICENGLTGGALNTAIRRWITRYHDDGPYCLAQPQVQ